MISEHQFATHYTSIWGGITPLADGFWAVENLLVERIYPPLQDGTSKRIRALVNETAFRAFSKLHGTRHSPGSADLVRAIDDSLPESIAYVSRFSSSSPPASTDVSTESRREIESLAIRLLSYFPGHLPTILRPQFRGCGLLSACEGDLIEGSCLYEVKAGDRPFRIVDLRQLLTYSALSFSMGELSFQHIGLFNPRTGVAWRKSLEEVSHSLSGLRLNDTLTAMVEQFSSTSASR